MLTFRPRELRALAPTTAWTVGVDEQAMVVDPCDWALVGDVERVVEALPAGLTRAGSVVARHATCTVELRTGSHATVAQAMHELGALRGRLTAALGRLGLRAAVAGTHPAAGPADDGGCVPTFGLHVRVGVPEARRRQAAVARLPSHLPLLLALSANSPFLRGRETGLASARADALGADAWCACVSEDGEEVVVRVMDGQTRLGDAGALVALAQCLVRAEARRPARRLGEREPIVEVPVGELARAAADGVRAHLREPRGVARRPAQHLALEAIDRCVEHALALDCLGELEHVRALAARPGETFQRARAGLRPGEPSGGRRLRRLTRELSAAYVER